MKKNIVISAISIRSGGMLSILQDCLKELNSLEYADYKIYAIVKDPSLISHINPNISYLTIDGTQSYFRRLYYEFFYFKKISKQLNPYLWLSLHDISPNVISHRQAVYCHNATPFYRISWREFRLEPKFGFFNYLYNFLYRVNIKRNDFVIVQQDWLRQQFSRLFKILKQDIIVARPEIPYYPNTIEQAKEANKLFIFPSVPRVWKNFEIIGEAVLLLNERGISNFEVMLTIDGKECKYSQWLNNKYGNLFNLSFIGNQPREKLFELYAHADCLIFPSRLESWGLPISEFKNFNKPVLLADLPYTHETVGDYEQVSFFDPSSPDQLADLMMNVILDKNSFQGSTLKEIQEPFARNWKELFHLLLR